MTAITLNKTRPGRTHLMHRRTPEVVPEQIADRSLWTEISVIANGRQVVKNKATGNGIVVTDEGCQQQCWFVEKTHRCLTVVQHWTTTGNNCTCSEPLPYHKNTTKVLNKSKKMFQPSSIQRTFNHWHKKGSRRGSLSFLCVNFIRFNYGLWGSAANSPIGVAPAKSIFSDCITAYRPWPSPNW